jgi:hypothetical protein
MIWVVITFYMILARGVVANVRVPFGNGPRRNDIHIACHGTANAATQEKLLTVMDSDCVHATLLSVITHVFVSTAAGSRELTAVIIIGKDFQGAGLSLKVSRRLSIWQRAAIHSLIGIEVLPLVAL